MNEWKEYSWLINIIIVRIFDVHGDNFFVICGARQAFILLE